MPPKKTLAAQQLEEFTADHELLMQQWKNVREALRLENNPVTRTQLEAQAKQLEAKIQALETEINHLEAQTAPQLTAAHWLEQGRKTNDFAEKVRCFTEALQLNPQHAEVYNLRGLAYDSLKNYDAALADFTAALRLNPDAANVYNNRGLVYLNGKHDPTRAIADFEAALRIQPDYERAQANLKRARG